MKSDGNPADGASGRPTSTTRLVVRSYEVDGFRHVNNAIIVRYLEAARGDVLRAVGLGYQKFHDWAAYPVVTHLSVDYVSSALADDPLDIEVTLESFKRTRFVMSYRIRHTETGALIVRAETHHAFVDPTGNPIRVPEAFHAAFERTKPDESD